MAAIAEKFVQPQTKQEISALLGENASLVSVADWADEIRGKKRITARWHYVNIPKNSDEYVEDRDCPKAGCLVTAINHFEEVLADRNAPKNERASALKFLVHFVGDLHQPLHCGYREDKGGEWVKVKFYGRRTNLHKVWDSDMLARNAIEFNLYVEKLAARVSPADPAAYQKGAVLDWVYESRAFLKEHVYDFDRDKSLADDYFSRNISIVDSQLLKAGLRLAGILDRTLAGLSKIDP